MTNSSVTSTSASSSSFEWPKVVSVNIDPMGSRAIHFTSTTTSRTWWTEVEESVGIGLFTGTSSLFTQHTCTLGEFIPLVRPHSTTRKVPLEKLFLAAAPLEFSIGVLWFCPSCLLPSITPGKIEETEQGTSQEDVSFTSCCSPFDYHHRDIKPQICFPYAADQFLCGTVTKRPLNQRPEKDDSAFADK